MQLFVRRIASWLLCCLVVTVVPTDAATVSVAANLTQIQNAIDTATANSNTTIEIGPGTVHMGTAFIALDKTGVSLKGAGPGLTIFETNETTANTPRSCYAASEGTPLLSICQKPFSSSLPTQPTIIEGITFRNSAPNPFNSPYVGAEKGIGVWLSGPSAANPSIIRNCEFINLWKNGPTGIGIEFVDVPSPGSSNFWRVENNTFDGTKSGVYVNGNNDITIASNVFTRFRVGIINDAVDKAYNLNIAQNTFTGGWGTIPPSLADPITAISLSANANADGDDRGWNINNNLIQGVRQGIEIRYQAPGPASLNGVAIKLNNIAADRCSIPRPCFDIINSSPEEVDVTQNWWGDEDGPDTSSLNPSPGGIIYDPWIKDFVAAVPCPVGFCPTNVVLSNQVAPVITSVVFNPAVTSAPSILTATVTFEIPLDGTLTFSSTPPGILCPTTQLTLQNPAVVTCAVGLNTPSGLYNVIATVAANNLTASRAATVTVCANLPWPFRANAPGCQGCSYNCATNVFSCSSCPCHCLGGLSDTPDNGASAGGDDDTEGRYKRGRSGDAHGRYEDKSDYTGDADGSYRRYADVDAGDNTDYFRPDQGDGRRSYEYRGNTYTGHPAEALYDADSHQRPSAGERETSYAERPAQSSGASGQSYQKAVYGDAPPSRQLGEHEGLKEHMKAHRRLASISAKGRKYSHVHTSSLWNPFDEQYVKSSSPGCPDGNGNGQCICGPPPLTVGANCATVRYNPFSNTFTCSAT